MLGPISLLKTKIDSFFHIATFASFEIISEESTFHLQSFILEVANSGICNKNTLAEIKQKIITYYFVKLT